MKPKKKIKYKPQYFVVAGDHFTDAAIRRYITDTGGDAEDEVAIPYNLMKEDKNGIRATEDQVKFLIGSESQVLGGKLDFTVVEKSKVGRFLIPPRQSLKDKFEKKGDSKAQSENARLSKQIQEMVKNRAK